MPELRLHYTHHRRADRRAGAGAARHRRLGRQHADARLRRRIVRRRPAARCRRNTSSSCRTRIGPGKSSKPSDGLRAKFPRYNYDDMVAAQHRLVTEGLGIKHLRLVIGNSMGGMQAWMWGATYPDFMDALVPMASQPTAMASRNWMMRRMMIDAVRNDPDWKDGNYTDAAARVAASPTCSSASPPAAARWPIRRLAPTREQADKLLDDAPRRAVHRRRQRLPLSVGIVARLRSVARPRARSRPRCWRSTPPTTSAIRRRPASWSARSSA